MYSKLSNAPGMDWKRPQNGLGFSVVTVWKGQILASPKRSVAVRFAPGAPLLSVARIGGENVSSQLVIALSEFPALGHEPSSRVSFPCSTIV